MVGPMGKGMSDCVIGPMGPAGVPGRDGRDSKYFNRKPIFIIRFPNSVSPQRIAEHKEGLDKNTKLDEDYHVLIMKDHDPDGDPNIRFEVLNCSEMTDTRWNDLIDMVMDDLDPDRVLRRESEALFNKEIGLDT